MKEKILLLLRENGGFVSGQELSGRFGVSRTSIWKAVRQLEEQGYLIEAVRNRGYRLLSEPDLLTAERVKEYLQTEWAGHPVLVFDSLDSTNNEVKRRAGEGAGAGLLVISGEQTAGRGRLGRSWDSESGEGIFMSLLLKPDLMPDSASMLTLVMGMAVREAIERVCAGQAGGDAKPGLPGVSIKWPNDIITEGKKVCGILTEMSAEIDCIHYIVIGVGINVHNTSFPGELADRATSIYLETGKHLCRAELVAECMRRFEKYYEIFMRSRDLSALADEYDSHLVNRGREIRVPDPCGEYTGTALGINDRGELLVRTGKGERRVASGEVSVRGVYGYI